MKNLFVPFDIAVLAKEKGFNEPCLTHYYNADSSINGNLSTEFSTQMDNYNNTEKRYTYTVSAPLYQQLTDWLRGNYGVLISEHFNGYDIIKLTEKGNTETVKKWLSTKDIALTEALKLISLDSNNL